MASHTLFKLRPTERKNPTGLETAFRVEISTKEFKALGLVAGDLIQLSSTSDDSKKGHGIAWLASQTNPGSKAIAKVTDLFRERFGFSLNDSFTIEATPDHWRIVDHVEITPTSSIGNLTNDQLMGWAHRDLMGLDIIVPDFSFEVQPKGLHKIHKIQMKVVNTEPLAENAAFKVDLTSRVTVAGACAEQSVEPPSNEPFKIDGKGIGGMSDHIATINKKLAFMKWAKVNLSNFDLIGPTSFLIHGPERIGKSLLLDRISQCPWRKVFRLDQQWLSSHQKAPVGALCDMFEEARNFQPSVVLMDRLDAVLKKSPALTDHLETKLKRLRGLEVAVVATARSIYDVDESLRTPDALKVELELGPPNVAQREDILRQILEDKASADVAFSSLADRTHGYVGGDMRNLCMLASEHRAEMLKAEKVEPSKEEAASRKLVTQDDINSVIDQVRPSVLKEAILEVPKIKWTDVAGLDHVREQIDSIMIRPFKHPELTTIFGAQTRKGVLLYGPPGCAKTLIAQAVATESHQNFLAVKGSELIKMYVGESERAIRDVFRRARSAKPCIIFFDEVDAIGKSREKSQDSGLNVVTTLLNEMDGIEALKDVFIIGATNRPDILDSALTRPGRFDALIHIGLPNHEAREQIFQIHTRKSPLATDVDLKALATQTEGSSGADIKGLCAVAVELAISDYTSTQCEPAVVQPEVGMSHFEQACRQHVPHTRKDDAARYESWRPGKALAAV
ncbi:AAA-domain-containing protein [Polyplosphaeria fusca]|uniref:AAA-domain-containing protein n=1 Tax=Polyplosphaeria fusca TaxID=682080 RepID=A0A9P4QUS3_9PLEO|nr:AAA-domain-containing protein [Polyplosphaeria fusca]